MTVAEIFDSMAWGPAPEAVEPALVWLDQHERRFGHVIGGERRAGERTFEVFNPANRQLLAHVAHGTVEDVEAAVTAARDAFPGWSATPGHLRARYLYALARQIQKHSRLFAVLESLDNGKPIRESRDIDVPLVARHFAYHAGWAQLMGAAGVCADRRRRADHPLEFPAADAGLEGGARPGDGQHRGAQASRVHAAHGAVVC
jgi:aldehyde dehydrogenase (NAD+)